MLWETGASLAGDSCRQGFALFLLAEASEQPPAQIAHGVPHGQAAHAQDGEEHRDHVARLHADGEGVGDELPRLSQGDEAVRLLEAAQQYSQGHARQSAEAHDQPPFAQEDAPHQPRVRPEVAERLHVVALLDHEHGQRADQVEAGQDEDERQQLDGRYVARLAEQASGEAYRGEQVV